VKKARPEKFFFGKRIGTSTDIFGRIVANCDRTAKVRGTLENG
jgi:hypothetical protein